MIKEQRHNKILKYLQTNKFASSQKLVALLGVSVDTVRRDIKSLESAGLIKSVHGGASLIDGSVKNMGYEYRKIKNIDKKKDIANYVRTMVKEDQTIALNAGTTNIEVAKVLVDCFSSLTVITNSLEIARIFSSKDDMVVIVPGGFLNHEELSLYGKVCEAGISSFNIDTAILSVNAISLEKGITDFRVNEVPIIQAMEKSSNQTIAVCDDTKLETYTYINVGSLSDVDMIITNSTIPKELYRKYINEGINLLHL